MYNVMFMKADKFGNLPYDMDGVVLGLMDLIMCFARSEDGNFEKIKSRLEDNLRFTKLYGLATEQTTVNIIDEPFFPRPKGHMRKIKISFLDQDNTTFEFSLARKTDIKTLKDLALNAVISNVSSNLMINKMEIPETLRMTLRTEFYNEWSRKRFPSYNITLLPFAEYLKAGGIDARSLDQIMDDYMHKIEMTQQMLSTGFPDLNAKMEIVWKQFYQEIARRLRSPGLMDHLNQTLHELGVERCWAEHAEIIPSIQQVAAVEAMEQDQPLDLSLGPPRF